MADIIKFLNRNWLISLEGALRRHYYPGCQLVDARRVKGLQTKFGSFHFSTALQTYYNLFEQIETYKVDDLRKTDVVIDIGANIGAFTVMAASNVREVIAVEPLFCDELRANVELNNLHNVRCLPYAIGEGRTQQVSFCNQERVVRNIQFKNIIENCTGTPTFLKIDCEGGEWVVKPKDLAGFRAVEAEVHNFNGENPVKFLEMLQEIGFICTHSMTKEGQMMISARREL